MTGVQSYRNLVVWQKSVAFVTSIYTATAELPSDERSGLTAQVRRAAVAIPSNIAEGHGRATTRDFIRFCHIASGSLYEVQTQLEIARNLGFLSVNGFDATYDASREIERMLSALIRSLEARRDGK